MSLLPHFLTTHSICRPYFFPFFPFPKALSSPSPRKTKAVPSHCLCDMGWAKMRTEPRMVKNLRVVVKMEHSSGPNVVTVMKMKFCKLLGYNSYQKCLK